MNVNKFNKLCAERMGYTIKSNKNGDMRIDIGHGFSEHYDPYNNIIKLVDVAEKLMPDNLVVFPGTQMICKAGIKVALQDFVWEVLGGQE